MARTRGTKAEHSVNIRRNIRKVLSTTLLAALVAVPPFTATAAPDDSTPDDERPVEAPTETPTETSSDGSFAVQPSGPDGPGGRDYFIYTLDPGQLFGDTVGISNLGSEPVTYALYATDAFNTRETADFALLREEEPPTDVGSWIDLGVSQVTVDPGTRVDVPFSIEVPDDATPGDHAGAIVAQAIPDASADEDGVAVEVRLRIGARVYVRVSGTLAPSLTVEQFRMGYDAPLNPLGTAPVTVDYTVTNTGNTRITADATLVIEGVLGLEAGEAAPRRLPELLPGSSIQISETVGDVRPLVRLTADLRLEAPLDGVEVERSVSTWAIPWIVVIVVVALMGLLVWRVIQRFRQRGRADENSAEAEEVMV
jgi:uncharacterized membrane protein